MKEQKLYRWVLECSRHSQFCNGQLGGGHEPRTSSYVLLVSYSGDLIVRPCSLWQKKWRRQKKRLPSHRESVETLHKGDLDCSSFRRVEDLSKGSRRSWFFMRKHSTVHASRQLPDFFPVFPQEKNFQCFYFRSRNFRRVWIHEQRALDRQGCRHALCAIGPKRFRTAS